MDLYAHHLHATFESTCTSHGCNIRIHMHTTCMQHANSPMYTHRMNPAPDPHHWIYHDGLVSLHDGVPFVSEVILMQISAMGVFQMSCGALGCPPCDGKALHGFHAWPGYHDPPAWYAPQVDPDQHASGDHLACFDLRAWNDPQVYCGLLAWSRRPSCCDHPS